MSTELVWPVGRSEGRLAAEPPASNRPDTEGAVRCAVAHAIGDRHEEAALTEESALTGTGPQKVSVPRMMT